MSSSSTMDSKKSNKITDIVRLQQLLKKWKKLANSSSSSSKTTSSSSSSSMNCSSNNATKSIKFLKKTLSFSDVSTASNDVVVVPKGFLAVCVGRELKRFIIPTEYLSHQAFGIFLREAEEQFGFQQEGVLKIPCEVHVFEKILKVVEEKRDVLYLHEMEMISNGCCSSSDCELTPSHHFQLCR
ncbi:hypothetical protein JRO89_XS09G0037000 [Xanthoceras sorbifolium]|uniref:Uncharacterized protein n=1 Tax=Xanthoceras sorbifolium TaxID=99658 RepID=A0ABQ8HKN3_9ROSI|nr:hypothetical protein JRO89_XS09G0037000 [Xanthoceras sorbifolium]